MTKILVILGIVLVIAGGTLTALSDPGNAGTSSGGGSDSPRQTREATAIPQAEPTASPTAAALTNRQDCAAIRGRDYLSPEERTWFLANCVTQ